MMPILLAFLPKVAGFFKTNWKALLLTAAVGWAYVYHANLQLTISKQKAELVQHEVFYTQLKNQCVANIATLKQSIKDQNAAVEKLKSDGQQLAKSSDLRARSALDKPMPKSQGSGAAELNQFLEDLQ